MAHANIAVTGAEDASGSKFYAGADLHIMGRLAYQSMAMAFARPGIQHRVQQRTPAPEGNQYGCPVSVAETVLNPGPIPYSGIALYGDPDLEHGLREEGLEPDETTYRLVEIPLTAVTDTHSMPWPHVGTAYVEAIEAGQEFPPIVVMRNKHGWGLIDGCNRTHAYWTLGKTSVRAYELLTDLPHVPWPRLKSCVWAGSRRVGPPGPHARRMRDSPAHINSRSHAAVLYAKAAVRAGIPRQPPELPAHQVGEAGPVDLNSDRHLDGADLLFGGQRPEQRVHADGMLQHVNVNLQDMVIR